MSLDKSVEYVLSSISARGDSSSTLADQVLGKSVSLSAEGDSQFPEEVTALCEILHIPPTNDVAKISRLVLASMEAGSVADYYLDVVENLSLDEAKVDVFTENLRQMLTLKNILPQDVRASFGLPSAFNRSHEENYAFAKVLTENFSDADNPAPEIWNRILSFKGRVLDD